MGFVQLNIYPAVENLNVLTFLEKLVFVHEILVHPVGSNGALS